MTIEELGVEYLKKADLLTQKVTKLKAEIAKLPAHRRKLYNKRLYSLMADALECRKVAHHLCDYYKNKEEK